MLQKAALGPARPGPSLEAASRRLEARGRWNETQNFRIRTLAAVHQLLAEIIAIGVVDGRVGPAPAAVTVSAAIIRAAEQGSGRQTANDGRASPAAIPTASVPAASVPASSAAMPTAAVEAAAMEAAAPAMKPATVEAASASVQASSGRGRFSRAEKGSHKGQSGQTRYGRSGYGVSHRGELQSFRVQRRKAGKVPFLGAVRAAPGNPLREALSA
jgi:hypothetical protein